MTDAETVARAWFEEFWNKRDPAVAKLHADEKSRFHNPDLSGGVLIGVSKFLDYYHQLLTIFPDIRFTVHQTTGSGATAAVRWTASGTHKGAWLGHAPTNQHVDISGMGFVTIENGKIIDAWDEMDRYAVFLSLGKKPTVGS